MARKQKVTPSRTAPVATPAPSVPVQATNTPRPARSSLYLLADVRTRRAFYLVLLAALYAPLSQLNLAPVYGSIPSAVYHKYGLIASSMLSFAVKGHVPARLHTFVGAFVFWIPIIQYMLFSMSSILGNPLGPFITECLTLYPLVIISIYLASKELEGLNLSFLGEGLTEAGPPMTTYLLFTVFERILRALVPTWMGMSIFFTRIGLQVMTAATYTAVIPGSLLWPALPAIIFNGVVNVHTPLMKTTDVLNNTLHLSGYTLIDRKESLSGYISVLQDNTNNLRVMRCDHSLLGGEWLLAPDANRRVAEPVYAVFTMLESVRLVKRSSSGDHQTALNIGLGVGTAPSALIAHGVETTIIELDPVVHRFATQYFGLPKNHSAYLADAVAVVNDRKAALNGHFDYVIHDVFTGGAEPVELFTEDFLLDLKSILKPDGVIAINYAGDLATPSSSLIYRTIIEVFKSCRVFREDEQVNDEDKLVADQSDFTNMVFICNKNGEPVEFRKAEPADYLGSASRKAYMVPKHEVISTKFETEGEILTRANTNILEKLQVDSALGHWHLMRRVVPAAVWENW